MSMKLKFVDQQYQADAVNAIVNIFEGAQIKNSQFTIDISQGLGKASIHSLEGEGVSYELGYSNKLTLTDEDLLTNVRNIQVKNNIIMSKTINDRNFTIEMETGTGKTYVYINTILELHKRYGFTKFIVVVPSIAIKEGVNKSFEITKEHFMSKYDNEIYNYFVYDSSDLAQVQSFAVSTNIEIMIINIDAFKKSFTDLDKESKANIIHRPSDRLSGNKPIDLIASTRPIVIIDESQSVDHTPKAKDAIASLNPLCKLRYSATHRDTYNLMYQLTPVDAYQENLVKHIEVSSIQADNSSAKPYVKLISINTNDVYKAQVEINFKTKDGTLTKKTVTIKPGDDLWEKSNEVDYYKDTNFVLDDIGETDDHKYIYFSNGERINVGEAINEVDSDAIKRAQIRETIALHLAKEESYLGKGIKVLSLFFIDRVENYRLHDKPESSKGKYALWFEEEFKKLINGRFKDLKDRYEKIVSFDADKIHNGYFAKDKKGNYKNTNGVTKDDEDIYQIIMRDKEKLLSIDYPLRFIFSHSALKEGWDNPNVFQVCTLVESQDTMTKRQKIGRGLRICVNQDGERVLEPKYNVLSVIANEAYKDFAKALQKELEKDDKYKFGIIESKSFANLEILTPNGEIISLNQEDSIKIFDHLISKEYLKPDGKVQEKFFTDIKEEKLELLSEYMAFNQKIVDTISKLSRNLEIIDVKEKIKVNLNKKVYLSEKFDDLWKRINRKTLYSVKMDLASFKKETVELIQNMNKIEPVKIKRERTKIDITKAGVVNDGASRHGFAGDVQEFETVHYPDFIRRIQDATNLLRPTIIEVISNSGRLSEFYKNPEVFIKNVVEIINSVKKRHMINGIQYHKTDDYFIQEEIFNTDELYSQRDRTLIDISDEKNIFDHVIFDSIIEKQFALEAENDEDVILYGKLPSKFVIDTPLGDYNPDWVIVLRGDGDEDKLYFVTETKGSMFNEDRREKENHKILCGRKHFEVLDNGVNYVVATELRTIKQKQS